MNRREFISSLGAAATLKGIAAPGRTYDLVVAGGGPAGIAAAVTAGRLGLKVALLEGQGALGGVWTSGLLSCLLGFDQSPMDREFITRLRRWEAVSPRKPATSSAWIYEPEYMKRVCEDMCDEAGVEFVFNSPVVAAEREGRRVVAALTESKSGRTAWKAQCFMDCTGDGDLAALAGCGFSTGGYSPSDAEQPASLIALVMLPGNVPVACIANDDSNFIPVELDAKAAFRRELAKVGVTPSYGNPTLFRLRGSLYALMANHEYDVKVDDAAAITRATVRARREVIDMVDALAKKGGEPWRGARVVTTAPQLAHRRARRIHGRYTLALEDLLAGRQFDDGIASCDFCLDVHAVSRAMNAKNPAGAPNGYRVKPYQIPLRACQAADVDNLYMAGRCISGEFLPQASYRITGAAVGMGAGVAEAIAKRMKKVLVGALAFLALHASAGDVVWRDTFDSQSSLKNWYCESGFSVLKGEGVDGSGALVWKESAIRPKPPPGTELVVQEEDNIVRKLPQDGRKICRRLIPVEPGCRYTVSLKLKGAITNNCGYVFFDWYGRDGGRRGHCVAKPTIWKDVGTNGWQTLSISSQRMPADAAVADVYLEFYRTTLGRMAFDDFTVTRDGKRFVEQMFSSAYRDEQTGGKVRFVAPYVLSKGMDVKDVSARFSFAGKEGSFAIPADMFNFGSFETTIDAERLAFGANEVKAELLHRGKVLDSCAMTFVRSEKPSARKVSIDGRGMTYVDGKPFFPIGVYVHPKDKKLKYLDRLKGGPFNCVIECAPQASILNRLHRAGLMAIPKSPRSADAVRSRYAAVKDHPAILAWYVIDEAQPDRALSEIPLQKLRRELDPDHPTIAVLNQAENAAPLMGCFDIIARDPYPLSVNCHYPPGGCDRKDLLDVAFWPKLMKENCYGLPPVWQVPQAFSWGWIRNWGKPELDRYPTYDELRSMSWQSIAGGANGILWYAASMIFDRMEKHPEEGEKCWSDLVKVAEEIAAKMPWFISGEIAPDVADCPDAVAVRTFMKGGKVALLVTNRTSKPVLGNVRLEDGIVIKADLPSYGVSWIGL